MACERLEAAAVDSCRPAAGRELAGRSLGSGWLEAGWALREDGAVSEEPLYAARAARCVRYEVKHSPAAAVGEEEVRELPGQP